MIYVYCHPAQFMTPSGLGVLARECLPLGKVILNPEEITNQIILNAGMPCPLPKKNRNYLWTTFETSEIPIEWRAPLNSDYQAIFVPHEYVRQAFLNSGITTPIHVIHMGFKKLRRTKPINKEKNKLKLGIVGYFTPRKNLPLLCEAVNQLNNENIQIELSIQATSRMEPHIESALAPYSQSAHIQINYTRRMSDEELAAWYSSIDAYCYPSSAEGWSMTPRESLYLGIPTIISDIEVHKELTNSGYVIPIHTKEKEYAIYRGDPTRIRQTIGTWDKITVEEIKKSIIQLYKNYDIEHQKAIKGAAWIKDKWPWHTALEKIKEIIEQDNKK